MSASEIDPAAAQRRGTSADAWEGHWRAYDEAAHRNPAQRYRRTLILDRIRRTATEPLRILDVGCGQGDFLADVGKRFPGCEAAGVDVSSSGLELARSRVPGARLFRADFAAPDPLPAELRGYATHVICSEVLEHLDDPQALLRKIIPTLAPGGELIVTVPGGPRSAFDVHIGHRRHYSPAQLEALARSAGYAPRHVAGAGFPVFNAYKLVVVLRGRRLAQEIDQARPLSRAATVTMAVFDHLFRLNFDRTGLGWQTFGVFALTP